MNSLIKKLFLEGFIIVAMATKICLTSSDFYDQFILTLESLKFILCVLFAKVFLAFGKRMNIKIDAVTAP